MSSFAHSILSILKKCESKKLTEKKKGIEDLRDIYDLENARAEITQKSDEEGGEVTWNMMLNYCHQLLVNEIEKPGSRSIKICTEVQSSFCQLITQTVSHATNSTSVHLKLSTLMTSIITILDKNLYKLCHSSYLKMLVDYVLSNRLYRIQMTSEYWQELLRICLKLYPNSQIDDKCTILKALQKIVHYGCLQSNLLHDIKELLSFLKKVYSDVIKDNGLLSEPSYKLTYIVMQQIGTECRQSLCEFSENFPPVLIALDGSKEKFKVLLYFVVLHHPNGASMAAESSYVCDVIKWRRTIIAIKNAIFKEMKPMFLSLDFIALAVEVFKQIIEDPNFRNDEIGENESQRIKRRRYSMNFQSPIDLLNSEYDLASRWPIIQILSSMFEKYPQMLQEAEYPRILKIVSELFKDSITNGRVMKSLCQMGQVLIKIEMKYFSNSLNLESNRQYWDKIWDVLLKILGMSQNETEGHQLLQFLIEFKGVQNINAFVNLYFTNSIRWSPDSIRTLLVLLENVSIPEETEANSRQDESDKKRLMRWIFHGTSKDSMNQFTMNDLCEILSGLTLKTYTRRTSSRQDSLNQENYNSGFKYLQQIEKCALSQMFETELFQTEDSIIKTQENRNSVSSFSDENLEFVVQLGINSTKLSQSHSSDKRSDIYRLTVIAKFTSNLLELNIEEEDQRLIRLLSHFENSFIKLWEEIIADDFLSLGNSHMIYVLRSLITFYQLKYHPKISEKILKLTQGGMLSKLFQILKEEIESESNDYQNLDIKFYENIFDLWDAQKNCKSSKDRNRYKCDIRHDSVVIMGVYQLLMTFCTFDINEEIAPREIKVLQNLLKIEQYDQSEIGNLWKALSLLKTLTTCRKGFLPGKIIGEIGRFIQELLKVWKKDSNGIIGILQILPDFVKQLSYCDRNVEDFLKILQDINGKLTRGYLGPSAHVTFLQSLNAIMKIHPSTIRRILGVDVLIEYLNSPFYVVRIEALNVLHFCFASSNVLIEEKKILFQKIIQMFDDFFEVDGKLTGSRFLDEAATRRSSALCMLGCIINASGVFQPEALNMLLKLNWTKMKDTAMIHKILSAVMKNEKDRTNLIEKNLYHLVNSWLLQDMPLEDFPWNLTGCETEVEFYQTYIGIILLSKLGTFELSCIENICKSIPIPFENVIEANFPAFITWLLTAIANSKNQKAQQYATSLYERLMGNSGEFSSVKTVGDMIDEKLDAVLIDLIQRLHDERHFNHMFGISIPFPEMLLPNFQESIIEQALGFLEKITSEKPMIEFLVIKQPSIIQRVLSTLLRNIYEQRMIEYKLKAFHHYSFFCRKLMQEISHGFFDEMATFTLRDISYSLVHLIKEDIDQLSEVSAKLLLQILRDSLSSRSNEISKFFNFLVTSLIPIVQLGKIKTTIKIIEYLIIDSTDFLRDSIPKLNQFPNELAFYEMRAIYNSLRENDGSTSNLKSVIEHFLNSCHEKTLSYSLEGLMHLKIELSNRREELKTMYKDLEKLRGFAEDCISSTLHRLIHRLIKLTESPHTKVSLEAAECLGQLGPADLTTMILHPEEGHVKEEGDFLTALTLLIIAKLSDFVIESCLNLRDASAEALYEVYSSSWGQQLIRMANNKPDDEKQFDKIITLTYNTRPFFIESKQKIRKVSLDYEKIQKYFDENNDLWFREKDGSYSKWIRKLTCKVLSCFDKFYSSTLIQVCKLSVEFCELIFPRLIFLVIDTNCDLSEKICSCINRFFGEFYKNTSTLEQTMATNAFRKTDNLSQESVKCMLNVVDFIRIQSGDNYQSQLNYLHIAKAAQYCSAYFTSVLYAELSSETLKVMLEKTPDNISIIDHFCETKPEEGKSLQDILREAFVNIGDPDSIHGCGLSHLKDQSSRIQHYIHFQQWDKALIAQDVELSSGFSFFGGLASSLQNSALDYLLSRFISTVKKDSENVDEYMYDTAWRLGDWTIFRRPENSQNILREDYDFYHYQSLKSMNEKDLPGLCNGIESARISAIKSLRNTSLECSKTIYPTLVKLQMLREIEELGKNPIDNWSSIITSWKQQQDLETMNDFSYVEPILSQRIVMYRMKNQLGTSEGIKQALVDTQLELSRIAEKQGHFQNAARALESLARQDNLSDKVKNQLNFREALLAWKRGDQDIARYLLRNLINRQNLEPRLRAQGLKIFGNWVAETMSETPQAIIDKYYEESIKIVEEIEDKNQEDKNNINDTYMALAQFADAQYEQISDYIKGSLFEGLQENAKFAKDQTSKLQKKGADRTINKVVTTTVNQTKNDVAEVEKIQRNQSIYLQLAVENYLLTLINGEKNNFSIFRLFSLWFENRSHPELNQHLNDFLEELPTYKIIPLLPQMTPHVSAERNDFTLKINNLLKRCALNHPHHVLPYLLVIKNREEDKHYRNENTQVSEAPANCVKGAKALINELNKTDIRMTITEMDYMANAFIELAYYKFENTKTIHQIPARCKILKVRNFQNIIITTNTLEIKPTGNYDNVVGIMKYEGTFSSLGGINAPKKLTCIGTDGTRHFQVLKLDDDIKTDQVMQQVFGVVNSLFRSNKETQRRKLNIRTYKVVSLSQRSGVLQWCDNTMPILTVLLGDGKTTSGLHKKYNPTDWNHSQCDKRIKEAAGLTNAIRLKTYLNCCENLQPAFQYFFIEKFPSPETWFERRLAYVRSIATTSMVGYILGLGDRHLSNILIDQSTAEVVHIDFGIAFEQGKSLPIPEPVPFRLSRDIEAAMGVSGVEGVLRRSCEETMTVLRDRKEVIITLLDVLLYDPLFTWTVSPYKAHNMQSDDHLRIDTYDHQLAKNTNKSAKRALLRIEQKLLGTEGGGATSISGQVESLIQQARDPANLSLLFAGWRAYL